MDTVTVTSIYERLSDAGKVAALDYMKYLYDLEGRMKEERARKAFERFAALLDGDTGWASEEEMIADLAEFRRKRESERVRT